MSFKIKLISDDLERFGKEKATRFARLLMALGITPNGVTTFGLLLNLLAAYFVLRGELLFGAIFLVVGGIFDLIDGSLARVAKSSSKFGSFWDLVADRIAEAFFYLSLIIYFVTIYNYLAVVFALFAMAGSWLVTYSRSCAEQFKIKVQDDFLPHSERIIILALTLAFERPLLGLFIVAVLTISTLIWRILFIFRNFQGSYQKRKQK
jgi:phosphatidylglycerophosphate synthase